MEVHLPERCDSGPDQLSGICTRAVGSGPKVGASLPTTAGVGGPAAASKERETLTGGVHPAFAPRLGSAYVPRLLCATAVLVSGAVGLGSVRLQRPGRAALRGGTQPPGLGAERERSPAAA